MENIKQHDHRTTRRPDCVTEIRMGNTVLVVSGFFKKDTTSTAADKMARWSSVKISDSDFEKILPLSYAAMLLSVACCM